MPKVLVIADKAIMRLPTVNLLKRNGFEAVESEGGAAATALYESARPDAVLLDISLAEEDGLVTLRRIAAVDARARVAVISGQARREIVLAAATAGAIDFLVKPYPQARLLQAVRKLVSPPTERQHPRVATSLPATLALGEAAALSYPCVVEDLSVGGARCRLARPVAGGDPVPGASAQLRFALPGGDHGAGDAPIVALGRVVRVAGAHVISVAFLQLARRDHELLDLFCRPAAVAGSPADRRA